MKNDTTNTMDGPICTEPMTEFDRKHPVPCPGVCGFNFCLKCVEHLIETSKMGYEEASDGSKQMKVKLICPQVCHIYDEDVLFFLVMVNNIIISYCCTICV